MPHNFEPKIEVPPINIDTALNLIQNLKDKLENPTTLEKSDAAEIGYVIKSLQDLQNEGFAEPEIAEALTQLIYLRDQIQNSETNPGQLH